MLKLSLTSFVFLFHLTVLFGQHNDYIPLKSFGIIPQDFTKLSSAKYEEDKQSIDVHERKMIAQAKDKFFLETNFEINEILHSGKVMFNDPVTQYLEKVAGKLLEHDPDLKGKIRLYAVKSNAVNAFATNGGIIFVNLGLISKLENEAQLAYVLSHELTHYLKKHVINKFIEVEAIKSGKGNYRKLSVEERFLAKTNYSKEIELEADLGALDIYLKSNYNPKAILGVFDILKNAHMPFEDLKYEKGFLETPYLAFPDHYYSSDTLILNKLKGDDEDDSRSSHPATSKRKKAILSKIDDLKDLEEFNFQVSKEEFLKARTFARYEMCRIYLLHHNYEQALYQAYLLLQKDSNSVYLQKTVVKALYGLSKFSNSGSFFLTHKNPDKIKGHSQPLYRLFHNMKKEELNILALWHLWKLNKELRDDEEVALMTKDIFKELVFEHYPEISYFSSTSEVKITSQEFHNKASAILVLDDSLKNEEEKETEINEKIIKYALVDLLKDSLFTETYKNLSIKKENTYKNGKLTLKEKNKKFKMEAKERRLCQRKGKALNLNKIVFVNPYFRRVDERKKEQVQYVYSEHEQHRIKELIEENANQVSMEAEILDVNTFAEFDYQKFNENSLLDEWLNERLENRNLNFVSPIHNELEKLTEKYGTSKFCWIGAISHTRGRKNKGSLLLLSFLFYPTLPFAIYNAVTPENEVLYYALLFDLNTGNLDYNCTRSIKMKDKDYVLNSNIYFTMLQFKYKRNK